MSRQSIRAIILSVAAAVGLAWGSPFALGQPVVSETRTGGAAAVFAVVRQPSHGASCTVIATEPGRTLLLGCAHAYQGEARGRAIVLDVPHHSGAAPRKVGPKLLAVDYQADLSLVLLPDGPLPYVSPVAPAGTRPRECWSAGYDEMQLPPGGPVVRSAQIVGDNGQVTYTRGAPWHGRSGGALIDTATGQLVGVVGGYSSDRPIPSGAGRREWVERNATGFYASLEAIHQFLSRHASGQVQAPAPEPRQRLPPGPGWDRPPAGRQLAPQACPVHGGT